MNFRNVFLALFAWVVSAQAHPGHDLMAHGAGHVATSIYHLWILFTVGVFSFVVGQVVRSAAGRKVFRAAGVTALIAAGALWSLGF